METPFHTGPLSTTSSSEYVYLYFIGVPKPFDETLVQPAPFSPPTPLVVPGPQSSNLKKTFRYSRNRLQTRVQTEQVYLHSFSVGQVTHRSRNLPFTLYPTLRILSPDQRIEPSLHYQLWTLIPSPSPLSFLPNLTSLLSHHLRYPGLWVKVYFLSSLLRKKKTDFLHRTRVLLSVLGRFKVDGGPCTRP